MVVEDREEFVITLALPGPLPEERGKRLPLFLRIKPLDGSNGRTNGQKHGKGKSWGGHRWGER